MRTLWTPTILLGAALCFAVPASGQGAFQTLDPFYQDESARRDFFGGVAVSGEIGYRQTSLIQPAEGATAGALALSAQVDYALLSQVDLSAIIDLSGGVGRGPVGLSWIILKPYWHNERTDYAVRIAIDPASEGRLGFRQTDVAFLSTTALSPTLMNNFAIGIRRVSTGYEAGPLTVEPEDGTTFSTALLNASDQVRLIGRELHASWGYNAVFDPGGSQVSVSVLGEAGDYTLVTTRAEGPIVLGEEAETEERIRSGIGWLRAGVEFSRPSYQLAPYISVPLVTWASVRGEPVRHGPRPDRARFGLRLTLR